MREKAAKFYLWGTFLLALVVLTLLFLPGAEKEEEVNLPQVSAESLVAFHDKGPEASPLRRDCSSQAGCHSPFPHTVRNEGPFLNHHSLFLDCFVCHMYSKNMGVEVQSRYGERIVLFKEVPQRQDFHGLFSSPPRCEGCHSRRGALSWEKVTGQKWGKDFVRPQALLLLREGSKKWFVPGF